MVHQCACSFFYHQNSQKLRIILHYQKWCNIPYSILLLIYIPYSPINIHIYVHRGLIFLNYRIPYPIFSDMFRSFCQVSVSRIMPISLFIWCPNKCIIYIYYIFIIVSYIPCCCLCNIPAPYYYIILFFSISCHIILYYIKLYCIISYHILYFIVLYYFSSYYIVLYYIILNYIVL